jgi:putative transposase
MPHSTDDPTDWNTEIALFRYGLIAPLVHDPPAKGLQEQALRELAAKTYRIPGSPRTRVSLTTLRRYLKAYQAGGFEALRPPPRADRGAPRAFPVEVLERAVRLREEQPARTTPMIVEILRRDESLKLERPPNAHTLTTHLRRRGKTRRLLAQSAKAYQRFEREHPNDLWQGDMLFGPWLPDPALPGKKRRAHLFCFIDDHSRLVPYAEFFFDEALPRMERVLKVGLLRRGVPKAIYVDNGQVYSATQFGAACATLRIQRIHSTPYAPEGRGKIERFFETLRTQFLPEVETSQMATLTELNESLWAWIEVVYHQAVHSETQQTPLARFTTGLDQIRTADPETLRRAFLWREKRKVYRDATISLQGNRYQVQPHWAGRTLELRFDPFDLSQIELYLDGQALGPATVLIQNRQRHLAVERLVTEPLDPPKPKSSLDFLAALRAEHHAQQQKALGRLSFAQLPSSDESQTGTNRPPQAVGSESERPPAADPTPPSPDPEV